MEGGMSRHFSREALLQLLRGPASQDEGARALRHAVECRRCRVSAAGWLAREKAGGSVALRSPDPRDALVAVLEEELSGSVKSLKARSWWAEIKDLSPEEQI